MTDDRANGTPPVPAPGGTDATGRPGDSSAVWEALQLLGILRRRWLPMVITTAVVSVAVVAVGLSQPKQFRATSTLHVGARTANVLHDVNDVYSLGPLHPFEFPRYMETQAKVVRGREIASEVVTRVELGDDLEFLGIDPELPAAEKAAELERIDPVRVLQDRILTEQVGESNLLRIVCDDTDARRATDIVNAFADVFIVHNSSMREVATESAVVWLKAQLAEAEARVAETEALLLAFREENAFLGATVEDAMEISANSLIDLNAAATEVKLERLHKQARWGGNGSDAPVLPEIVSDPLVREVRTELLEIRRERADLSARYGERHPSMDDLDIPEKELEGLLDVEVDGLVEAERAGIRALAREEKAVLETLGEEQQRAHELHRLRIEYSRLERELDAQSELLDMLQGRFQEARLAEQLRTNNISVVEYAPVPTEHFKPRIAFVGAVALAISLIFALTLALVLDRLDSKIRTQHQVERELGVRVLGIQPIPRVKQSNGTLDESGVRTQSMPKVELMSALVPKSYFAECLRTIRTNLMFSASGESCRTILVTSAMAAEGKTSFATNLALTYAAAGKKTLLVDTDLRLPSLAKIFETEQPRGQLVKVLSGDQEVTESLYRTPFDNLKVMLSGKTPANPAELLASTQFRALHASLTNHYDRIIFDSPPCVPVTDAKVLAQYVDGVILVVRQNVSDRHLVQTALRQLRDVDANLLGCVFNGADARGAGYGYGYGYRYG